MARPMIPAAYDGPTHDGPIGILDSGVGGLSVLRALRRELPHETYLYIADQAHLPYGPRPLEEIRLFASGITRFLLDHGAKIIVVACNAASAAGLHYLRETFPGVPFVGMEPAVKPAALATRSGVVGVLTTAATANGSLYASVKDRFAAGVTVHTVVCPELVLAVERGEITLEALRPLFDRAVAPILAEGVDQIVLACTHFPFAMEALSEYAGPGVSLIDPSPAIARQTHKVLEERALLRGEGEVAPPRLATTGDPDRFAALTTLLLAERMDIRPLLWDGDTLIAGEA